MRKYQLRFYGYQSRITTVRAHDEWDAAQKFYCNVNDDGDLLNRFGHVIGSIEEI